MGKLDILDPRFRETLELVIEEVTKATGYEWRVVGIPVRTIKEQHKLYLQPHDGIDNDRDGKVDEADETVTKADGGSSPHNYGMAADIAIWKDGDFWWNAPKALWRQMADIAVRHGLTAGFYFKSIYDAPHVEDPRWRQQQAMWKAGKLSVA